MFSKEDYEKFIIKTAKAFVLGDSRYTYEDFLLFTQACIQYKTIYGEAGLSKMGIYVTHKGFDEINIYINLVNLFL